MMRKQVYFLMVLAAALGAGTGADVLAGVQGTKHDLSAPAWGGTGPGPIRSSAALGTSEICVFCHTPHSAASVSNAPLWNKSFNPGTDPGYTVYSSDVMTHLGYPPAEKPLTSIRAVHLKTRLCLTCHDGTIALGGLANLPVGYAGDIPMVSGAVDITTMPTAAEGYIGVDLRDDHPVAIQYTNANDPELTLAPGGKITLYPDGGNQYVECTSCHEPHDNTAGKFLVETNQNSGLCTRCHIKTGFVTSVHADTSIPVNYAPPTGGTPANHGPLVGNVRCMNCHYPHKSGISDTTSLPAAAPADLNAFPRLGQYLLALQEEMSCYNEKNRWGQTTNPCHASVSGDSIKTETIKTNAHRAGSFTGIHEATEHRDGTTGLAKYNWINSAGAGWHVECDDCHNSHTAGPANHSRPSAPLVALTSTSPLYGAGGVSVSGYPTLGGAPGAYGYIEPQGMRTAAASTVQYEYQICFKCHSDFGWGNNPPASPSLGSTFTNQAAEFNPANQSFHPVVQQTGRAAGTPLAPWAAAQGNQVMYCSDCHTKEGDGTPTGPHGSSNPFILRDPYSDTYSPVGTNQASGDVCFACHDPLTYLSGAGVTTGFSGGGVNLHTHHMSQAVPANTTQGYKCVNCHTRIPHGWFRKGMIIVNNEGAIYGAQYEAGGAGAGLITSIVGGTLPASGTYPFNKAANCSTVAGCH